MPAKGIADWFAEWEAAWKGWLDRTMARYGGSCQQWYVVPTRAGCMREVVKPRDLDGCRNSIAVDVEECLLQERPRDKMHPSDSFHAANEKLEVTDEPRLFCFDGLHNTDASRAVQR